MSLDDLNREQKRMLKRQGALDEKGAPTRAQRQAPTKTDRVGPAQYLREVRDEMRKVAWPTRAEVMRYSIIVIVTRGRLHGATWAASTTCSASCRGLVLRMSDMTTTRTDTPTHVAETDRRDRSSPPTRPT